MKKEEEKEEEKEKEMKKKRRTWCKCESGTVFITFWNRSDFIN